MSTDYANKSGIEQIRQKFNGLVDKYSNLETGQATAVDSVRIARLIASVASNVCPHAVELLDIGCGAGNYSIRIASGLPDINVTLVDLSEKMLERAQQRLQKITNGKITQTREDIRTIILKKNFYDIVVAGTSLHHLREDSDWEEVFGKIFNSLKPGGSFWISDLIKHDNEKVHQALWEDYAKFLKDNLGEDVKNWVFEQMEIEDTPRSVGYQMELLKKVGFGYTEILHKNMIFAAFGGIKPE